MSSSRKSNTRLFSIGMATIVSAFLLYFGISFLKGTKLIDKSDKYYMILPNSGGLEATSQVTINGFKVGKVSRLHFDYQSMGSIVAELSLEDRLRLPIGTTGTISSSLMGGSTITLTIPTDHGSSYYTAGDTIPSIAGAQDLFASVQDEVIPSISQVAHQLDSLLTGLQAIVSAPEIPTTLAAVNRSAIELQQTMTQISRLAHGKVPTILANLETTSTNVAQISTEIESANIESIISDFELAAGHLRSFTAQLQRTDNTVGLLLNDSTLYQQLSRASASADSLLVDLKRNPKRYVHFSLF